MNTRQLPNGEDPDILDPRVIHVTMPDDLSKGTEQDYSFLNIKALALEKPSVSGRFRETMDYDPRHCAHVYLGRRTFVGKSSVIGCPKEQSIRSHINDGTSFIGRLSPVKISDGCLIGNHVSVYEGVKIGIDTVIEDYVRIGYNCQIGKNARIMYSAYICDRVSIGDDARISGFICDGAKIGERSSVMGNLIHEYANPHLGWWETDEEPPIIESDVVVGWGASIIGAVRVSSRTYIASGAIVTKDVPSGHIVVGVNQQIPLKRWRGQRLANLIRYWGRHDQL